MPLVIGSSLRYSPISTPRVAQTIDGEYRAVGIEVPAVVPGSKSLAAHLRCVSSAAAKALKVVEIAASLTARAGLAGDLHNGRSEITGVAAGRTTASRAALLFPATTPPVWPVVSSAAAAGAWGGVLGDDFRVNGKTVVGLYKVSGTESYKRVEWDLSAPGISEVQTNIFTQTGEAGATTTSGTSAYGKIVYGQTDDSVHYFAHGTTTAFLAYRSATGSTSATNAAIWGAFSPLNYSTTPHDAVLYAYSSSRMCVFFIAAYTSSGKTRYTLHMSYSTDSGATWTAVRLGTTSPVNEYYYLGMRVCRAHPTDPTRVLVFVDYVATAGSPYYQQFYWVDTATFTYGQSTTSNPGRHIERNLLSGHIHQFNDITGGTRVFLGTSSPGSGNTIYYGTFSFDYTSATAWKTPTYSVTTGGALTDLDVTSFHYQYEADGDINLIGYYLASTTNLTIYKSDVKTGTLTSTTIPHGIPSVYQLGMSGDSYSTQGTGNSAIHVRTGASAAQMVLIDWSGDSYRVYLGGTLLVTSGCTVDLEVTHATASVDISTTLLAASTLGVEVTAGVAVELAGGALGAASATADLVVGGIRLAGQLAGTAAAYLDLRTGVVSCNAVMASGCLAYLHLSVHGNVSLAAFASGNASAALALYRRVPIAGGASAVAVAACGVDAPLRAAGIASGRASMQLSLQRGVELAGVCAANCMVSAAVQSRPQHVGSSGALAVYSAEDLVVTTSREEVIWTTPR